MVKRDVLFVKSRIKSYVKNRGFRVSSEILNGTKLDDIIKSLLDKATERTKANKRKTVKPFDLFIRTHIQLPIIDDKVLNGIISELKTSGINERGLMYYDIITYIIRHVLEEPEYDQIIRWCNANIKNGKTFLD